MLKAWDHFHRYEEGTNCRAWLFRICKNTYINGYRRKKYEPLVVDFQDCSSAIQSGSCAEQEEEVHLHLHDDRSLERHGGYLSDEVMSALEAIPADYQTALILCDVEEFTYEEIASFTQTAIGTVRSRIHRGRRMLADHLADYAIKNGYSSQPFDSGKDSRVSLS
jgi:RNA polymerase sigma-70 factor (ECF subfamily)